MSSKPIFFSKDIFIQQLQICYQVTITRYTKERFYIRHINVTFCFNFSRAILCYLVNKYGQQSTETQQLYPKDPELRANVDRMLFYDSGSLYKNVIDYFVRK